MKPTFSDKVSPCLRPIYRQKFPVYYIDKEHWHLMQFRLAYKICYRLVGRTCLQRRGNLKPVYSATDCKLFCRLVIFFLLSCPPTPLKMSGKWRHKYSCMRNLCKVLLISLKRRGDFSGGPLKIVTALSDFDHSSDENGCVNKNRDSFENWDLGKSFNFIYLHIMPF